MPTKRGPPYALFPTRTIAGNDLKSKPFSLSIQPFTSQVAKLSFRRGDFAKVEASEIDKEMVERDLNGNNFHFDCVTMYTSNCD